MAVLVTAPLVAYAAVTVTVNGTSHTIPQTNERGWGNNVTAWIQAISANTLQPSGGTFTLTADTNFGANYGLVSTYFKSRTSNISTSGVLRLANTDSIGFRNAANGGNLLLGVDSSDRLTFNGGLVSTPTTGTFQDSTFEIYDNGDNTKKIAFQASGITTATTRTITMPDANVDLSDVTTATSSNTASKIVKRDGSGNFSAGTITADLTGNVTGNLTGDVTGNLTGNVTGNASTATALAANPSDCGADTYATTIAANGNLTCATVTNAGLAGSIAASKLVGTDIATVGTITSGTWNGTTIAIANGGTGQTTANAALNALLPSQGSNSGKFLTTNGTDTSWASPAGSALSFTAITGNTTLTNANDYVSMSTNSLTVSVFTASGNTGKVLHFIHNGTTTTHTFTIDPNGAETVGGAATYVLHTNGQVMSMISDGSNWQIVRRDNVTRFVGSAYFPVTTNCQWRRTNTAIGAFGTDTDCTGPTVEVNPGPGTIQTTDADLPQVTVNNLPAGTYRVRFAGSGVPVTNNNDNAFAIYDGTNTYGEAGGSSILTTTVVGWDVEATFTYSSSGNRTFELHARSSVGSIDVTNNRHRLYFIIDRISD